VPDVSIWEAEFREHRVPPVCMKSGAPAEGTWTAPYVFSSAGVMRAQLPLAGTWLARFTALLVVRVVALAIAVPLLGAFYLVPNVPALVRPLAFGALMIGAIAGIVLWSLLPRWSAHRLPTGQRWLNFVGVHPMFINAMNRARLAGPSVFSPDLAWYWDGARWTSNKLPAQWWRRYAVGIERMRRWQITLVVLVAWVVIGVVAWVRFHS
jgi:hypothetical protein